MKKLIAGIMAVMIMAIGFAGCNNDPLSKENVEAVKTETTEATTPTEAKDVEDKVYDETVDGLAQLFVDKGYMKIEDNNSNVTEMDASLIGAKKGKKYSTTYNGAEVIIEFYSFDMTDNKLKETAEQTIKSVKENGWFQIFKLDPVKAYLADGDKFLMIYTDKSNPAEDSDNYKRMQEAIETFKDFPAYVAFQQEK